MGLLSEDGLENELDIIYSILIFGLVRDNTFHACTYYSYITIDIRIHIFISSLCGESRVCGCKIRLRSARRVQSMNV